MVFDWCHDLMTPTQISTFMARYNYYTGEMIKKEWGGWGFYGNNYFWGYLRSELEWAVATYYENPWAQTFLYDALVTRGRTVPSPICGASHIPALVWGRHRQGGRASGGIGLWAGYAAVSGCCLSRRLVDGLQYFQSDQLVQGSRFLYDLHYVL